MCFVCVVNGVDSGSHRGHIEAGQQGEKISSAFTTGPDHVTNLLFGFSWTGTFGQATTVNYHFDSSFSQQGGLQNALITQQIARAAMQEWSNVANITFNQGASGSPMLFTTAILPQDATAELVGIVYPTISGTTLNSVEVQIDIDYARNPQIIPGGLGFEVMLHEIGHALGLKHPFDAVSGTGGTFAAPLDSKDFSVMAYDDGPNVNGTNYISAPMVFDIAAAQYLYGANMSYRTGDDAYVINGGKEAYAIWDAGGNDSIVAGTGGNHIIDLTDTYQFDNPLIDSSRTPGLNKIGETVFYAAFGSNLEYAIGNSGNDWVDGNDNNNTLLGHVGSDVIDGWEGNDTLYGGRAILDLLDAADIIRGDLGNDAIYGNAGNDTLFGGGGLYQESGFAEGDPRSGVKVMSFNSATFNASQIYGDDTDGSDTIYGGFGSDYLFGNGGNDSLYGGGNGADPSDAADTLIGGRGADILFANGGDDLVIGGNNLADVGDGNDTIYGGFGNDSIYANSGDDVIYAGPGNDVIHGGTGNDSFYIYHNDGIDRLLSFDNPGASAGDRIYVASNINGSGIVSAADVLSHITYANGQAVIHWGGFHTLTIEGVSAGSFTADDFTIY